MKIICAIAALAFAPAAPLLQAQNETTDNAPWNTPEFDAPPPAAVAEPQPQLEPTDRSYPFRRSLAREDIEIRVKKVRLDSGKRVSLVYGSPKRARNCPAVFVMDVEVNSIAYQSHYAFGGMSRRQRAEIGQAGYLTRSPFGSNLLGSGFAVAYVVSDDLDAIRSARTNDWIGIFDRVRNLREVDDDSFFLFSTREYANVSIFLAANYSFAGFILEEPSYLLFSRDPYENVVKKCRSLTSDQIWQRTDPSRADRYIEVFRQITAPIMLIRDESSIAYDFNEKTLIPKLIEANTYFESVNIGGPTRELAPYNGSSGVLELAPQVSYHPRAVSRWLDKMITYLKVNSATEAISLRDPAKRRNG